MSGLTLRTFPKTSSADLIVSYTSSYRTLPGRHPHPLPAADRAGGESGKVRPGARELITGGVLIGSDL